MIGGSAFSRSTVASYFTFGIVAPLASRAVTVISILSPTATRRVLSVTLTWLSPSFSLWESQKTTCLQNLRCASRLSSEERYQTQVSPP